jgi:hypothetical protein
MLDRRLDQLCFSLDDLAARLRAAVAQAVGESLGGLVRDAVLSALARLAGHRPDPEPSPSSSRRWDEPGGWEGDGSGRGGPALWSDDGGRDQEPETYGEPGAAPPPHRLALTASAGLQAAAWWLRSCARQRPVLTSVLAALLVGAVAFATPALATAFLGLGGSTGPPRWLAGSLRPDGPLRSAFALS